MRNLAGEFQDRFGLAPVLTVAAPGRVNLMGDHTDHAHLPVLPVAIGLSVTVSGVTSGEPRIEAESMVVPGRIAFPTDRPPLRGTLWEGYLGGVVRSLGSRAVGRGAKLLVAGDLPPTGGLSSSSALTVALLGALDRLWDLGLDRPALVEAAVAAERTMGVEGGTMDQTVIVFARPGAALRIDFEPPSLTDVPVPGNAGFVIGYSGRPARKAGDARSAYNGLVVAGRAAALLLSGPAGLDPGDPPRLGSLRAAGVDLSAAGLPGVTTPAEVAAGLGMPVGRLTRLTAGEYPADARIDVAGVAHHMLTEAARVDAADTALRTGDPARLGRIFDASHASMRRIGAVTPGLDALCTAAVGAGALGARVTGAGFGGWGVAVCAPDRTGPVAAAMIAAGGGPAYAVAASGGMAVR